MSHTNQQEADIVEQLAPWGATSPEPGGWGAEGGGGGWGGQSSESTEVQAETVSETGWESDVVIKTSPPRGIGRLPVELVSLVLMFIVPGVADVSTYTHMNYIEATIILDAILAFMQTSPAWYECAQRATYIWAALLPFFRVSSRTWKRIILRAGRAPLRLLYNNAGFWPRQDVDEYLDNASGIYANTGSQWRNWSRTLLERNQPLDRLLVLHLHPDTYHIPTGLLSMPARVLDAPYMWICEIPAPLLIRAPNLVRLVVSHCSGDQVREMLASLGSLEHLEIHRPRGPSVDWTQVMAVRTQWPYLNYIKIWCRRYDSLEMSSSAVAIIAPRLKEVDIAGALLFNAPALTKARILNTTHGDLVQMLESLPAVCELYVPSLQSPFASVSGPYPSCGPVTLPQLRAIHLTSELRYRVLDLMRALVIPNASALHLTCDASALPDRAVLPDVVSDLQDALSSPIDDLNDILNALGNAQKKLERAGFPDLGDCGRLVIWPTLVSGPVTPLTVATALDATVRMEHRTRMALEGPAPLPCGELLREVLKSSLVAMGIPTLSAAYMRVRLDGSVHGSAVCFSVRLDVGGHPRTISTQMEYPRLGSLSQAYAGDCRNSLAYGSARMFDGLRELRIVELHVVNTHADVFEHTDDALYAQPDDLEVLGNALNSYTATSRLVIEHADSAPAVGVLEAIARPGALPSLVCIDIIQAESDLRPEHPTCDQAWLDALELALVRRSTGGAKAVRLSIRGFCCIERAWALRMRSSVVVDLVVNVKCHRDIEVCWICRQESAN